MLAGSSLTPNVALLVHPSYTVHSIVICHGITYSVKEMMPVKAKQTLLSVALVGVSG